MENEQRNITFAWPRAFGLLNQVDVFFNAELHRGNYENQAIDKAAGNALFVAQCFVKLAGDVDRMDDVPVSIRAVWGLPLITEHEGICLWARHHGHYEGFTEAVEIIRQLVAGANSAEAILDKLAAFVRETLDQMIKIFLGNREKMKKEGAKL